ncbi:hypothetical protein ACNVED_00780 [Legionella sp. D16C41]|uniref:hypothetical protein n=1 Tax=Legionella sp. D16C41 TaxID=3402688 RepID=UPI003AF62D12
MKKNKLFIGTFYAALFGAPLLLVGCDSFPGLWGNNYNDNPYYANRNTHAYHHYNKRAARAETSSHWSATNKYNAANMPAQAAHTSATNTVSNVNNTNNSNATTNTVVAPKASSTAGSALESPVVPTTMPAVQ